MTSSNLTQGLSDESSKRKIEDEIAVQTRVARSKKNLKGQIWPFYFWQTVSKKDKLGRFGL